MKHVLVTGASGFVGRRLTEMLVDAGWRVTCLVRQPDRLPPSLLASVTIIQADINDGASYLGRLAEVDLVIHLAAQARALRSEEMTRTNVEGTRTLMAGAARTQRPPIVLLVSTLAAAGPSPTGRSRDEKQVEAPVSRYGRTKLAAEHVAREFADRVPVTILRPGMIFGGEDAGLRTLVWPIDRMGIHVFPGWNTRRASMIHIDDFVAAVVLAADQGERLPKHRSADNLGHGVYFVGDTRQPTYAGLGQIIAQAVGRKRVVNCRVPNAAARMVGLVAEGINQVRGRQTLLNHDKAKEFVAPNWTADVTKIHQQLGFRPAKSLDARWAEAIATYRGRRGAASSADAEAKVNADAQLETKSA